MNSTTKFPGFIIGVCFLLASCGGQNESKTVDVVVKDISSQNIERVFATYLLEQYRTVDEVKILREFLSIADWASSTTTSCPNGGTVKNSSSYRFEFDQCATSKGIIYSGVIDQSFIGSRAQQNMFYKNVKYRLVDDTVDQELNGDFLSGYFSPVTFLYNYARSGVIDTYKRESSGMHITIISTGFSLELKDVDPQGKPVLHVVTAKDESNLSIVRLVDGSVQLELRNSVGAPPIITKQYSASEVARILSTERKSK